MKTRANTKNKKWKHEQEWRWRRER